MKTKARFASNKTKLAALLGISRQWLHEFAILPDSPAPRADGMHSVERWRRFLAKHSSKVQGGTEKERIQIALLQIRLQREELEYAELDNSIREAISSEMFAVACQIIDTLKAEIERLPHRLSARFSGIEPSKVFKLFQRELDQCFQKAADAVAKIKVKSARKTTQKKELNVIPFDTARAGN